MNITRSASCSMAPDSRRSESCGRLFSPVRCSGARDSCDKASTGTCSSFARIFNERATKASLPDTSVDTQAAASYSAWQVFETAVTATKSLDDKTLSAWLKKNTVNTIQGPMRFDGVNNYGDDLTKLKQVQNGEWAVVWPKPFAKPGVSLKTP